MNVVSVAGETAVSRGEAERVSGGVAVEGSAAAAESGLLLMLSVLTDELSWAASPGPSAAQTADAPSARAVPTQVFLLIIYPTLRRCPRSRLQQEERVRPSVLVRSWAPECPYHL